MKEIQELNLPSDLRYAASHEYVRAEGDHVRIGIDDYAQDQLGEIVFVELPEPGATLGKGEVLGTVESVKAVSDLLMPVGGEVIEANAALSDSPQTVNEAGRSPVPGRAARAAEGGSVLILGRIPAQR